MKRREVLRKVGHRAKQVGVDWRPVGGRHRGPHEVWICGRQRVAIPRHAEINEWTAQGIFRDLEDMLGKDWWR